MAASVLLSLLDALLLAATVSVLATATVPQLKPFLKYGKTLKDQRTTAVPFLDIYVPKRWFVHFYVIHVVLSFLNAFFFLVRNFGDINDVQLLMIGNLLQSSRRLYECCYVSKFSQTAKMHVFHYLVGYFFYTTINLIPCLMHLNGDYESVKGTSIFLPVILFALASLDQFQNHWRLAIEKKYNLPQNGLFEYVVCPHYFDEIMIYTSLALIKPCLSTFLVVAWVLVNLSISARESYSFYKSEEHIKNNQKVIIPFIY